MKSPLWREHGPELASAAANSVNDALLADHCAALRDASWSNGKAGGSSGANRVEWLLLCGL